MWLIVVLEFVLEWLERLVGLLEGIMGALCQGVQAVGVHVAGSTNYSHQAPRRCVVVDHHILALELQPTRSDDAFVSSYRRCKVCGQPRGDWNGSCRAIPIAGYYPCSF